MPVKGLYPDLLQTGYVKIGGKGKKKQSQYGKDYRQPVQYHEFKITTMERGEDDNLIVNQRLMQHVIEHGGMVNEQKQLIGIPIFLLYNDMDMNFYTTYSYYEGITCKCRGDGESAQKSDGSQVSCPCEKLRQKKCKINGTLTFLIDGSDYIGSCFKFRTTSWNTCRSIFGSMTLISQITGGVLAFLPLMMVIKPKIITDVKGTNQKVSVVSFIYKGTVSSLQQKVIDLHRDNAFFRQNIEMAEQNVQQLIRNENLLPEPDIEKDIAEEFYPDADSGIAKTNELPSDINPENFKKYVQETLEKGKGLGISETDVIDAAHKNRFAEFREWSAASEITIDAAEPAEKPEGEIEF